MRILIVEDNVLNQVVAARYLIKRNHFVFAVGNGSEALALLERQPAAFDLVLMDVQMPEMDGLEATAAIRLKEAATGAHLPIIAVTAHAFEGDRKRCLAAGMDGYLSKPVTPAILFAEIARVIGGDRPSSIASAPAPGGLAPTLPKLLDRAALLERVEGDRSLLAQMVGIFDQEQQHLMAAIESAICAGDAQKLERASHTLKGMTLTFAATDAAAAAARLEEIGRSRSLGDCAAALSVLQNELAALQPLLAELCEEVAP